MAVISKINMLRISLIIVIVVSFNSCCLFVGKGPVYQWSKDKSKYNHFLKHQNSPSELTFQLTTDKKEYFIGEAKYLNLIIKNNSKFDSILILSHFQCFCTEQLSQRVGGCRSNDHSSSER